MILKSTCFFLLFAKRYGKGGPVSQGTGYFGKIGKDDEEGGKKVVAAPLKEYGVMSKEGHEAKLKKEEEAAGIF